jgi:hypothetical protein
VASESEVKVMRGWYTVNRRWLIVEFESGVGVGIRVCWGCG